MRREARFLAGLLGLWGGAFAWTEASRPAVQHTPRRFTGGLSANAPSAPLPTPWRAVEFGAERDVARDLFATKSTHVSQKAEPTATPVATASATPVPAPPGFRYLGFVADGNGRKVLLATDSGVRQAAEGDLLESGWRVEKITAEQIELIHLGDGRTAAIPRTP